MIQADLIKKAASLFLPMGPQDRPVESIQNKISGLEMLKQWQAMYGNPAKQKARQRQDVQKDGVLDSFNSQQLAYIRYLIEQQEGNILKQFQELI